MEVPDMMRTNFATYPESPTITNYKNIMMSMLHLSFPLLTETEIAAAVDDSISRHFKDIDVKIDNNYKKLTIDMTLLEVADYSISREPIITSY